MIKIVCFVWIPRPENGRFAHIRMRDVYVQIAVAVTGKVIRFDGTDAPVIVAFAEPFHRKINGFKQRIITIIVIDIDLFLVVGETHINQLIVPNHDAIGLDSSGVTQFFA